MKRSWCALLLALACHFASVAARAADLPVMKMGFYMPTIRDANLADVKVGLQIWADELGKSRGYRVVTFTFNDMGEVRAAVNRERLHMINAAGMELAEIFQANDIQGGFAKRTRGSDEGIVLVVAQGSPIRTFADLRGKRLLRLGQDRLSEVYLETQCLKVARTPCHEFMTIADEKRELQLAHGVFFGKADAALLTLSALHAAGELNPQVLEKLRVIQDWKTSALVFGMLTSHADAKLKSTFMSQADIGSSGDPRMRQMLELFRTEYVVAVGPDALDPYWALLKEYRALEALARGKRK